MRTHIILLALLMMISFQLYPQCDLALLEKLKDPPPGMKLLKCYSFHVREIKDVPYGMQHSYVFSRGGTYSFYLEHTPESKGQLEFVLSDNNGKVFNEEMKKTKIGTREYLFFEVPKTGIYFFSVHAKQSFDGCAVLQISSKYVRPKQVPCDSVLYARMGKPMSTGEAVVSRFTIGRTGENRNLYFPGPAVMLGKKAPDSVLRGVILHVPVHDGKKDLVITNQTNDFSYTFSSGTVYKFYMENKDSSKEGLAMNFMDAERHSLNNSLKKQTTSTGVSFTFDCKKTGAYYFNFDVEGNYYCVGAQLASYKPN